MNCIAMEDSDGCVLARDSIRAIARYMPCPSLRLSVRQRRYCCALKVLFNGV